MKSSTASGKSYIDVTKRKLPTQAPDDYSSGAFCIKLSPQWFGVVIGLVDHLLLRGVWEDKTDEQWSTLRRWIELVPALIVDCNQEIEPPPPPPPQAPSGDSGTAEIGVLGLTVSELEELIMGSFLRGQLAWIDGKLHYAVGGCDDWCPVPIISGQAPSGLTPEAIKALSSGILGLEEWEQLGQPAGSTSQPVVPSANPAYTTTDSMACAKASAFVAEITFLLTEISDGIQVSGLSIAALLTGIGGYLSTTGHPAAAAFDLATIVFNALVGISAQDSVSQINAALADPDWGDVICDSVPLMTPIVTIAGLTGNKATEADYKVIRDKIVTHINPEPRVMKILNTFPIDVILAGVRNRLPTQECECEQYLPYGYIPPAQSGAINFVELVNCGTPASSNNWDYIEGLPYTGMMFTPDQGVVVGANSWRTAYTGADTDSGEPNKYTKAALLFDMPAGTRIDQIKFDVVLTGVPSGAGIVNLTVQQVILNTNDLWQQNTVGDFSLASATDLVYDCNDITGSKMAILFQTRNENINLFATISNLRFTGDHAGGGFLDVPLGQPLP